MNNTFHLSQLKKKAKKKKPKKTNPTVYMQQKPIKTACLSMGTIEKEHKSNHCKMLTTNLKHFSLFTFYFFHCNQQARSEFTHQAFFFMTQHAHVISLPFFSPHSAVADSPFPFSIHIQSLLL